MSAHWRRARSLPLVLLVALVLVVAVVAIVRSAIRNAPPAPAAAKTVVSLTFDDGQASQYSTLSMLSAHRMVGTYYINSAMVGSSGYYMTWSQVHDLASAGNEIGGHTLHHANLTKVDAATAKREVCDDRTNLITNGFTPVTSFAYPEDASDPTVERIIRDCGYTTGRAGGNVACAQCPPAESIPPPDPLALRTPPAVTTGTTLVDLQNDVSRAETHGGGWVILTFHGICDNDCTKVNSMSPATFTAFLDWLAPRAANGTVVRTVRETMCQPPASRTAACAGQSS